jgi:hypothetical protein
LKIPKARDAKNNTFVGRMNPTLDDNGRNRTTSVYIMKPTVATDSVKKISTRNQTIQSSKHQHAIDEKKENLASKKNCTKQPSWDHLSSAHPGSAGITNESQVSHGHPWNYRCRQAKQTSMQSARKRKNDLQKEL